MSRIQEKLNVTPNVSGVYQMRDADGHIIYIGKARELRKRLSSYWIASSRTSRNDKVAVMLARVVDFDYFVTKTEKDALGLEANLIKKHKPHYNILLKDNKQFPYILIAGNKIEITRKTGRKGKYFGPYFNGIWASGLLDTIYDVFGVRGSGDAEAMERVKGFLRGEGEGEAREILTAKMEQAAEMNQFELAIRYRDGLRFLDKLKERTITQVARDLNADVFAYFTSPQVFAVSVLSVRAGKLIGIQNFSNGNFGVQSEDEMLDGFIEQYYLENPRPEEVVTTAEKGHKKKLLEMARDNAKEYVETSIEKIEFKNQFTVGACEELYTELGLARVPKRLECFDISNLHGEETVASMVVFIDGRAEKKLYRRFKIRSHEGIDDYKSMQEVLRRRMARKDWGMPDLIVIDGGKGQLSSVVGLVGGIDAIAFSERDEIFMVKGEAVVLSKRSFALRLLQRVRDEAHRFAVAYHHKRRDMKNNYLPKAAK